MRAWKSAVAVGTIALAVAGCGSEANGAGSGGPTSEVVPSSSNQGLTKLEVKECDKCVTSSGPTATVPFSLGLGADKETTKVEVTAVSVEKGTIADLKDFVLDDSSKGGEPYYVRMKFRNVGDKTADSTTLRNAVSGLSSNGDQLSSAQRPEGFTKCVSDPGNSTGKLAPGAEYNHCEVIVASPGHDIAAVGYYGIGGAVTVKVKWSLG